MPSDLEFFEELREFIGEEAARIITRRTDSSSVLAIRDDLRGVEARVSSEIRAVETKLSGEIHALETKLSGEVHAVETKLSDEVHGVRDDLRRTESRMYRWMLTFHAGQWVATAGLIVAIVLKG